MPSGSGEELVDLARFPGVAVFFNAVAATVRIFERERVCILSPEYSGVLRPVLPKRGMSACSPSGLLAECLLLLHLPQHLQQQQENPFSDQLQDQGS